ncbi:hypothetical protein [Leifsonia sp. P73]|uniref:hypothetical protein n=1 Tax=Leifsonia sp. P73 TaxID=3423959 RepID=UPI003DA4E615
MLSGLVLGTLYGWIGAQTLLGQLPGGGLVPPAIPWLFIGLIVAAAAVLAVGASVAPTRRSHPRRAGGGPRGRVASLRFPGRSSSLSYPQAGYPILGTGAPVTCPPSVPERLLHL